MTELVLDFETVSQCDLKLTGAWRYAEDPSTAVLCLRWAHPDGTGKGGWRPGQPEPEFPEDTLFIAHNCGFEVAIWRTIMVPDYGWKDVPNSKWHDTMAVCAMKTIPQKLELAVKALYLPAEKDMSGSKLTIGLSKVDRKTGMMPAITPAILDRVDLYCDDDVAAQSGLHNRIGYLSEGERQVWLLDQRINQRGLALDVPLIRAMQTVVDRASEPLAAEFRAITGVNMTQVAKVKDWVHGRGVHLDNMQAETLAEVLGESPDVDPDEIDGYQALDMPDDVRRALEIRQLIGSAAIKKLARAEACVMSDGIARGLLQYHGAGPGRWAGRLLQPHNFPRGKLKVDGEAPDIGPLVSALMTMDPAYVELLYGPAVAAVVSSLRHIIIARRGRALTAGDFAGIEARFTLALAGQMDKVALMAAGADVYCDMAESIYKRPINKKNDPEERQIGKNSVLGLGFQMGPPKFRFKYAKKHPLSFCEDVVSAYREDWAPEVPKLWRGLGDAAVKTVWDKTPHEAYGVTYALEDAWLTARLPSGRKLWYYDPQPTREVMPWNENDVRRAWTYKARKMNKPVTVKAFGGLLAENVAQGLARDLLVHAMFICERENMPIVLTVHDEIVAEPMEKDADPKMLEQIMIDIPNWVREIGVPVAAECWAGERYKK